ncbi:MAG: hypothetical protein ABIH03_01920 [Pseudomonadota bacterium]
MRAMSFQHTAGLVRAGQKTVTRRTGWRDLQPGTRLLAVERARGVPADDRVVLATIEIQEVRREPLFRLYAQPYGAQELAAEGFPDMSPRAFVRWFLETHACSSSRSDVTRIAFRKVGA